MERVSAAPGSSEYRRHVVLVRGALKEVQWRMRSEENIDEWREP